MTITQKRLTELSGSATSDVPSGSTHSLQDARNSRRSVIGSSLRDSTSNTPHEKTESSAIDPLSQVSSQLSALTQTPQHRIWPFPRSDHVLVLFLCNSHLRCRYGDAGAALTGGPCSVTIVAHHPTHQYPKIHSFEIAGKSVLRSRGRGLRLQPARAKPDTGRCIAFKTSQREEVSF